MILALKQKLLSLSMAGLITLGCAGIAGIAAFVDTTTNPTVAHADEWRYSNGGWWLQTNNGYATGWKKLGGWWYHGSNGWEQLGGDWYYFDKNGWMKTGWQWIGGKWYYFNNSGVMQRGWQSIGGKWYFLNDSMVTGWHLDNPDSWYYLDKNGVMTTGWNKINSKWYYFNKSGEMLIGWQFINGKWYHLNGSGAMDANKWIGNYYVKSDGSMATNQKIGQYYVGADGLWDGAKSNINPLHIETDFYTIDLPETWKNRVSYSTSGTTTNVYLTGRKDCTIFSVFAIPADAYFTGGDLGYARIGVGESPSGASVIIGRTNWPMVACMEAMGHNSSHTGQQDKFSDLIELQTNGTCTLDQLLEDPEAGQYYLLDNDYIFDEIAPSIKLRN